MIILRQKSYNKTGLTSSGAKTFFKKTNNRIARRNGEVLNGLAADPFITEDQAVKLSRMLNK